MESLLTEPTTAIESSAEDMLRDLEDLHDAVELKLESAPAPARARFERDLVPRLAEVRKLVAQQSPLAKNAIEDAVVAFRELVTVAPTPG